MWVSNPCWSDWCVDSIGRGWEQGLLGVLGWWGRGMSGVFAGLVAMSVIWKSFMVSG